MCTPTGWNRAAGDRVPIDGFFRYSDPMHEYKEAFQWVLHFTMTIMPFGTLYVRRIDPAYKFASRLFFIFF
jgi:hypothetical protein